MQVTAAPGGTWQFPADVRIDTPAEAEYYRHGGILQYVLRDLAARSDQHGAELQDGTDDAPAAGGLERGSPGWSAGDLADSGTSICT